MTKLKNIEITADNIEGFAPDTRDDLDERDILVSV